MIVPTIGRVVWFTPPANAQQNGHVFLVHGDQPCAAIVAFVHSDRMVNLTVSDHGGKTHAFASVTLVQDGDPRDIVNGRFCEWIPYQIGQAKKHESA